jgi:hypothetical protein
MKIMFWDVTVQSGRNVPTPHPEDVEACTSDMLIPLNCIT